MNKTCQSVAALTRSALAAACAAALLGSAAQAAVTITQPPNFAGEYVGIQYGQGGEVFQLQPYLFVNGLGGGEAAYAVVARTPLLSFSFSSTQPSPGLLVLQYTVTNLSSIESFDQLRFMVYANPDGDTAVYADRVGEQWGPAQPGDPDRRRSIVIPTLDNIVSEFLLNNQVIDAPPPAACTSAAGCDVEWALQWNAPLLGPGESFQVQVGLSDDGSTLSSRWLSATALNSPNTVMWMSGTGTVTPVPEPAAWLLLSCGLVALLWRRRISD